VPIRLRHVSELLMHYQLMLICIPVTHLRDELYGKRVGVSISFTTFVTIPYQIYRLQVAPRRFIIAVPLFVMSACRHGTGHGVGHFLNVHEGKI